MLVIASILEFAIRTLKQAGRGDVEGMQIQELRVMLVEDSPEDVAFTRRVLRHNRLSREMVVAASGKEAMQSLERLEGEGSKLPDLILLDINLPAISGIDLLTALKQDSRFCRIPVVMITGSNADDDIQKSYDLGACTYLVKPISKEALMLALEKIFG